MNTGPLVSVIVPTTASNESPRRIGRLLRSCLLQDYIDVESIVVAARPNPELQIVVDQAHATLIVDPGGKSACRNAGATMAHGELLLHLDEDMSLLPTTISCAVSLLVTSNSDAVSIPERLASSRIMFSVKALEKDLAREDKIIEAPRMFRAESFARFRFDPRLDPYDEGDLRERFIASGGTFVTASTEILVHDEKDWLQQFLHYFDRGRHAIVFDCVHPGSHQIRPLSRAGAYRSKLRALRASPSRGIGLITLKTFDVLAFLLGRTFPSSHARALRDAFRRESSSVIAPSERSD